MKGKGFAFLDQLSYRSSSIETAIFPNQLGPTLSCSFGLTI